MSREEMFKEQLFEFVEYMDEPFDFKFLVENCNDGFVEYRWIESALDELEEAGKIVRLDEHRYLSTRIMLRRWIRDKGKPHPISEDFLNGSFVSQGLIDQIEELLEERPELGYLDVDEFVRDAVRKLMKQFGKTLKGRSDQGSQPNKR